MTISSEFMFSSLKWLPFVDRVKYQKSILMYKIIHKQVPDYLKLQSEMINPPRHNLRSQSKNDLFVPRPNTNFYKRSYHYSAVILWNELPIDVKQCKNLELFKKKCFDHFLY